MKSKPRIKYIAIIIVNIIIIASICILAVVGKSMAVHSSIIQLLNAGRMAVKNIFHR